MAVINEVSSRLFSRNFPSLPCCRPKVLATITNASRISLSKLSNRGLGGALERRKGYTHIATTNLFENDSISSLKTHNLTESSSDSDQAIVKLYAIMEAVADRVEMHKNIAEQRDNWNHLLLTSVNAMTLTATTMAGLAAVNAPAGGSVTALKVSSTALYIAATGLSVVMNKIQPSQLAEEQRNAARLFKQLQGQIQTKISVGTPDINDVKEAIDKVLALDKAYPLPLLGAIIDKFPSKVEPARWWPPQNKPNQVREITGGNNGWNKKLEEEMNRVLGVLENKDFPEYVRLGDKTLKLNKALAVSGPLLTLLAALGSSFVGTCHSSWPVIMGVLAGTVATAVNTMEHGGQIGMVFEMYRSNAGFFKLIEESITSNTNEKDVGRRENGEILEMKVALQLGRSLSELKYLAAASSPRTREATDDEFASKLF